MRRTVRFHTFCSLATLASLVVVSFTGCGGSGSSGGGQPPPTENPVPAIVSLSPNSANAGGAAFTLTIDGNNFVSSSTVQWNGGTVAATYSSSGQLQAQISATDIASSGSATVSVTNPLPGGGYSGLAEFTINATSNPVPSLKSINPAQLNAGAPASVLTVNGENFANSSTIEWNGAVLATTYLSAPSLASANGNTVAALNPVSGTIQSSQFAGSEPDVLAISDDNQFLYASLDGSSSVRRFILPGLQPDISYSLGADPHYGPYFAMDLQAAPGLPHTSAVSRGQYAVSPVALGGMAIYDDAIERPEIADTLGPLYDSF